MSVCNILANSSSPSATNSTGLNFQLSYNVDEKKLREVFRLAGRCVTIELGRDKEGKSRGHAIVEYDHPVEAVQAISMFNNQMVSGQKRFKDSIVCLKKLKP